MTGGGAVRWPSYADRTKRTFDDKTDIYSLLRVTPYSPTRINAPSRGTVSSAPQIGGAGFLKVTGDTMIGPIAFQPVLEDINSDGLIDLSKGTPDYSSYALVLGAGSPDDLRFIAGAGFNGQLLYLQGTASQIINVKHATYPLITSISGTGTVTVVTGTPHNLTTGETVNIDNTTNFDVQFVAVTVTGASTFTYADAGHATPESSGQVQDGNIATPTGDTVVLDGSVGVNTVPVITLIFDTGLPSGGGWRVISGADGGGGEFLGPWTADHDAGNWSLDNLNNLNMVRDDGVARMNILGGSGASTDVLFDAATGINIRFTEALADRFEIKNSTNNIHAYVPIAMNNNGITGLSSLTSITGLIDHVFVNADATNAGFNDAGHTANPSAGVAGDFYYNTTDNVFKFYNGSVWAELAGGSVFSDATFSVYDDPTGPTGSVLKLDVGFHLANPQTVTLKVPDKNNGTIAVMDIDQTWAIGTQTFTASIINFYNANITLGDQVTDNLFINAHLNTSLRWDVAVSNALGVADFGISRNSTTMEFGVPASNIFEFSVAGSPIAEFDSVRIDFLKNLYMTDNGIKNANHIEFAPGVSGLTETTEAGIEYIVGSNVLTYNVPGITRFHRWQINGETVALLSRFASNEGLLTMEHAYFQGDVQIGQVIDFDAYTNGSPFNGQIWYDSAATEFKFRENGVTNTLGGGGIPTKIEQLNSKVEVVDAGAGVITTTVDGGTKFTTTSGQTTFFHTLLMSGAGINLNSQNLTNVYSIDVEQRLTIEDAAALPTIAGRFQRSGADVYVYSGGVARNLSNAGAGQTPWTSNIDADNFDLFDIKFLRGIDTGLNSFKIIFDAAVDSNTYFGDSGTSDRINVFVNNGNLMWWVNDQTTINANVVPNADFAEQLGTSTRRMFDIYTSYLSYSGTVYIDMHANGIQFNMDSTNDSWILNDGTDNRLVYSTADDDFRPLDNTSSCGISVGRWIDVWAVDGTINTSFTEFKDNIRHVADSDCLDLCRDLETIKFNWKPSMAPNIKEHKKAKFFEDRFGFRADILKTRAPEALRGPNNEGVAINSIVAMLLGAVRELERKINVLEAQ